MARKSVLDKDFSSLFDDNMFDEEETIQTLRVSEIEPNKDQPRKTFDVEALRSLSESIKQNGVLQPLLVRPMPSGIYQIVAGERRWRACKMAGVEEVPVLVRELSDSQTMQIGLIENLQRENLNPIEEALGYKTLIDNFNMTQEQVAKSVGKARSSISNALRLLSLPQMVKELLENGDISAGHGKALMQIDDKQKQIELALKAADEGFSVREMEKLAQRKPPVLKTQKMPSVFTTELKLSLSEALGIPVEIIESKKKKTLQIDFYDDDDLKKFANKIAKI
ncbi:MAG: ParB/RepB/Spo0J family partition protein [Clostridiales bacterium]|nr:ParB/RepB/Spo0J family partition protein [Clostridiales bacterium]